MIPALRLRPRIAAWCLAAAGIALTGGCTTGSLNTARHQFYQGRPGQAAESLATVDPTGKDEVLILMERGMARQADGAYQQSAQDFLRAIDRIEELETYSLSKGGATWVVNDTVQNFRGKPYERSLLHAFAAINFLALGQWDGAAVEARRLNETVDPDVRGDYPDVPFARYVAGAAFEFAREPDSAAFQYRQIDRLHPGLGLDPETGRWDEPSPDTPHELICFVLIGRGGYDGQMFSPAHAGLPDAPIYAEIQMNDQPLGRSRTLSDTWNLATLTEKEEATRKAVKTAARIAAKEAIAQSISHDGNDELGDLVRLILIGLLEQPDLRAWQTLPRWLQVARVPCPPDVEQFDVVLRSRSGRELARHTVTDPIRHSGRLHVSFFRDLYP